MASASARSFVKAASLSAAMRCAFACFSFTDASAAPTTAGAHMLSPPAYMKAFIGVTPVSLSRESSSSSAVG
eukprot:1943098-Prymnesium_polylepis.1